MSLLIIKDAKLIEAWKFYLLNVEKWAQGQHIFVWGKKK
jgi:hypothetical protein